MHITILTYGSRGDIQPFVALGVELMRSGHTVRLAVPALFKGFVTQQGLEFAALSGDPQALLRSDAGQDLLKAGANGLKFLKSFGELVQSDLPGVLADSVGACQGTDLIVATGFTFWGLEIAQAMGIPCVFANVNVLSATREFAIPSAPPGLSLPFGLNHLIYPLSLIPFWQLYREPMNAWRKSELGLPPLGIFDEPIQRLQKTGMPFLYGISPSVLPKPQDWQPHLHMTGYWYLDQPDFQPSEPLVNFLDAGEPPVYIGFGSMAERDTTELTEIVLGALAKSNQRGLLLSGWGGLQQTDLPDTVLKVDSAPHDWLLPRMKAVIHHGGAGTTAAAFRSGQPSMAVPFFGDQPFWGNRIERLGVGAKALPRLELSIDSLSDRLKQLTRDDRLKANAQQLGDRIHLENGTQKAVQIIENYLKS
jgi:sterol 3beta-glucosyltransferase